MRYRPNNVKGLLTNKEESKIKEISFILYWGFIGIIFMIYNIPEIIAGFQQVINAFNVK